ncbi:MAG TPA: class I SAM-dependent methyltransferase, partial [Thermoguttaceae bacterium]|nr:class I SAM-dependent methyltransferase [Thermoguttaceae bacterium]
MPRSRNSACPVNDAGWYDHPAYYDLAFRSETRRDADFIEAACRKYCPFAVRRLLEPGCGSGRLVVELARRTYDVMGFDLSESALEYLRRRLVRQGLRAGVSQDDMADFSPGRPVDAAYCLWNTFRHLTSESSARQHLDCVARRLRPGGIYIVGLHLLPLDV